MSRARSRWQSDAYAFRLWNGPGKGVSDEGDLKETLDTWIAEQCQQINPDTGSAYTVSEALRQIVHSLIRHWMGAPAPTNDTVNSVNVNAIAETVRSQVLNEVRGWLEQMRVEGYRAATPDYEPDADDIAPVTDDVISNILADFNGEFE